MMSLFIELPPGVVVSTNRMVVLNLYMRTHGILLGCAEEFHESVGEPAPARPFAAHGLAIFTLGPRRASSSLSQRLIASSCRARTNRGLVAEGWYCHPFTLYRHDSGSPAALSPKIAGRTAGRPVPLQFSEKSQRETQSRDDRYARRWPVAVSTQRPEPLPRSCGRGFIVRPTMRHLLRPVPGHMRYHLAALSTNPHRNSGSTLLLKFGVRLASRKLDSRVRTRRLASRKLESRDCFGTRLDCSRTRISRLFRNPARFSQARISRSYLERDRIWVAFEFVVPSLGARISRSA